MVKEAFYRRYMPAKESVPSGVHKISKAQYERALDILNEEGCSLFHTEEPGSTDYLIKGNVVHHYNKSSFQLLHFCSETEEGLEKLARKLKFHLE